MTTAWWWFVAMNAMVVAIAVLSSSCARPSLLPAPRRHRYGVTRRASSASAVLQSLLSFSIFSFPSSCLSSYLQPDADASAAATTNDQETETEELVARSPPIKASPRSLQPDAAAATIDQETDELVVDVVRSPVKLSASPLALQLTPLTSAPAADEAAEEEEEEDEDPNAMSMDEAYALVLASQQRPEREREDEARRSEVDAKAEEFIRRFKEELRQQRLNSISNYAQTLRRRAPASSGRRRPGFPRIGAD